MERVHLRRREMERESTCEKEESVHVRKRRREDWVREKEHMRRRRERGRELT